jgi:hypothetical protein
MKANTETLRKRIIFPMYQFFNFNDSAQSQITLLAFWTETESDDMADNSIARSKFLKESPLLFTYIFETAIELVFVMGEAELFLRGKVAM